MAQPPLLTLSEIALTFGGNPIFSGTSFAVHPGDRLCLVGRNGSGKSTLMKIAAGLVDPDEGERFLRPGNTVAYMEQDPDFAGFATLGDFASAGLDPAEQYKVDMVMEGLKLAADADPALASGGERRRAALARLLASEPDLMLLDEPTNHLDIEAIAWLEDHLKQTKAAFVLISHDRAFLRALARSVLWLDRSVMRRMDKGFENFEEWRDQVWEEEDMQRHKLNRLIKDEARWAVEGISARRKRNQGRVRRLQGLREERSAQIRRQGTAALDFEGGPKSGKLVVEAKGISKAYGDKVILRDFSLRVARGDRLALVGPNGAGKTTLLKLLLGQEDSDTGTIRLGTNLMPVVFDQTRSALDPAKSLWETLTGDAELGVSGRNDQIMVRGAPRHVVGYLKDFLFTDAQARGPVGALSGGEKARLLLARLMARESNLLILDEPTNDLDVETLDLLQELVGDYDGTVILVSHDRDFLDRTAATTILMPGDGSATAYAGGWSDMLVQRGEVGYARGGQRARGKSGSAPKTAAPVAEAPKVNPVKVKALEDEMERLTAEIAKLEAFLADPDLFAKAPAKFEKATAGLLERQERLTEVEEEWLEVNG
ncbi:ATP-binding cassette subfamily F protein uup [Rubricella aquisinus]|uniref:ATP-binding cassette subfamily F protein uup n=1 Tax=Rubricella aquisinus TaxID=2028108 RepID=A0A840WHY0_9RHOB|nr:ATP-binding cassette domain-containing protein [Rubricella aquisinus]MBB5514738.1 ATP-binding cassette subfamily F protein uup [Rubricella aquisinus]